MKKTLFTVVCWKLNADRDCEVFKQYLIERLYHPENYEDIVESLSSVAFQHNREVCIYTNDAAVFNWARVACMNANEEGTLVVYNNQQNTLRKDYYRIYRNGRMNVWPADVFNTLKPLGKLIRGENE